MPEPARPPCTALTPPRLTVITLLASVTPVLGVRIPLQVTPPSLELNPLMTPLGTVRSAVVKPVTAVLNMKVTPEVSPAFRLLSVKTTESRSGAVFRLTTEPTLVAMLPLLSPVQLAELVTRASQVARSAEVVGPVYWMLSSSSEPPPGMPTALIPLLRAFWLLTPSGSIESRRVTAIEVFQPLASTAPAELLKPKMK